jgi:NIPSNAP
MNGGFRPMRSPSIEVNVMSRLLEIRTYRLKPGTLDAFHHAMHTRAVPMLRARGMDVVAYGRSDHEEETYFLARSYASREALEQEQAEFYGSSEWKLGPRSELVDRIETYMNTLIWTSELAVVSMRELNKPTWGSESHSPAAPHVIR